MLQELLRVVSTLSNSSWHFLFSVSFVDCHFTCHHWVGILENRNELYTLRNRLDVVDIESDK